MKHMLISSIRYWNYQMSLKKKEWYQDRISKSILRFTKFTIRDLTNQGLIEAVAGRDNLYKINGDNFGKAIEKETSPADRDKLVLILKMAQTLTPAQRKSIQASLAAYEASYKKTQENITNENARDLTLAEVIIKLAKDALLAGDDKAAIERINLFINGEGAINKIQTDRKIETLIALGHLPEVNIFVTDKDGNKQRVDMAARTAITSEGAADYKAELDQLLGRLESEGNKIGHIRYVYTDDAMNHDDSGGYISETKDGVVISRIVTTNEARAHELREVDLAIEFRDQRVEQEKKDGKTNVETHVTNEDTIKAHEQAVKEENANGSQQGNDAVENNVVRMPRPRINAEELIGTGIFATLLPGEELAPQPKLAQVARKGIARSTANRRTQVNVLEEIHRQLFNVGKQGLFNTGIIDKVKLESVITSIGEYPKAGHL